MSFTKGIKWWASQKHVIGGMGIYDQLACKYGFHFPPPTESRV